MADVIEGETFRDLDWYGEEFEDRAYERCFFFDVDLTEAVSRGARFEECSFGNVRFNASRHTDSAFLRCVFTRCVFFEAEFTGCKLVGSRFVECELRPLRADGGDWSFVGLAETDLRGVSLTGLRMREVDLSGANCEGATLTGLDLTGAELRGARLDRSDLRGSDLSTLDPLAVTRAGARISAEQAVVIAMALGFAIG
ncbi:pentapeptide repeat-containing protein [Luedemannella helvata]|uniref:Pentapeptide repeat-containing protein n=1 Tax=Luedemannella helvata TaxID=349315 RepID=A0ABP4X830_9ACTN